MKPPPTRRCDCCGQPFVQLDRENFCAKCLERGVDKKTQRGPRPQGPTPDSSAPTRRADP